MEVGTSFSSIFHEQSRAAPAAAEAGRGVHHATPRAEEGSAVTFSWRTDSENTPGSWKLSNSFTDDDSGKPGVLEQRRLDVSQSPTSVIYLTAGEKTEQTPAVILSSTKF